MTTFCGILPSGKEIEIYYRITEYDPSTNALEVDWVATDLETSKAYEPTEEESQVITDWCFERVHDVLSGGDDE